MTVNYKIAKQLKEAGFPQKKSEVYWVNGFDDKPQKWSPDMIRLDGSKRRAKYAIPTIPQLINKLGDDLVRIDHGHKSWTVFTHDKDHTRYNTFQGNNFIIDRDLANALAKLWLKVQKG